jgi:hypothetical protein
MSYIKCRNCDNFHYEENECQPAWFVFHEDYLGEEPRKIHARRAEDAATKYGEYYNTNGDYRLMDEPICVFVTTITGKGKKQYKVSAEPTIDYYANEIV